MHTKRKISPLRISLFFCPKLGEDQKKKGLHSDLVWFLAEKYVRTKKTNKKKALQSDVRFCAQTLCPSNKGVGHAAILHILC